MGEICAAYFFQVTAWLEKHQPSLHFNNSVTGVVHISLSVAQEKTIKSETKLVHPENL